MATSSGRQYAARTGVGIGRTKDEIEAELRRLGATRRAMLDDEEARQAVVMFERAGRDGATTRYRLTLPLPDPNAHEFRRSPSGRVWYDTNRQRQEWQQGCAERWRALGAYVKALRVAHEAGILMVEEALLPYAVLADGRTVAEYTLPQLPVAAATRRLPPMLPGAEGTGRDGEGRIVLLPAPAPALDESEGE